MRNPSLLALAIAGALSGCTLFVDLDGLLPIDADGGSEPDALMPISQGLTVSVTPNSLRLLTSESGELTVEVVRDDGVSGDVSLDLRFIGPAPAVTVSENVVIPAAAESASLFVTPTGAPFGAFTVEVRADLVGGDAFGTGHSRLVVATENGLVDNTLALPTSVSFQRVIDVQPGSGNRIYVLARTDGNDTIVALQDRGALDTTFADGGLYALDFNARSLAVSDDGDVFVVGAADPGRLLKLTSAGVIDSNFGVGGEASLAGVEGREVLATNDAVYAVGISGVNATAFRFDPSGNQTHTESAAAYRALATLILANGLLREAWRSSLNGGNSVRALRRDDLSLQTGYGASGTYTFGADFFIDAAGAPDGRVAVIGQIDGTAEGYVGYASADGTSENISTVLPYLPYPPSEVTVDAQNRIVVVGGQCDPTCGGFVVRTTSAGNVVDTSFADTTPAADLTDIAIDSDGRLLIGGTAGDTWFVQRIWN